MHGHAARGLKIRDDLALNNEIQKLANTARSVNLALIKTKSTQLLDKEAACCNRATD